MSGLSPFGLLTALLGTLCSWYFLNGTFPFYIRISRATWNIAYFLLSVMEVHCTRK